MIELLDKYYHLKQKELAIKQEIVLLRDQIINELNENDTYTFEQDGYRAEIKYMHQVTPEFIEFLKLNYCTSFIKETASIESYHILKDVYHFTAEEQARYYQLKDTPYLYVRRI